MSRMATVAVPERTGSRPRVERWFYINVGLAMILLNLVAFAPGIVDPSQRNVPLPLTPLVTAHAVLSAAWLVLFLGQATSMATRRVALHRRVGTHQINGDVSDHRPWSGAPWGTDTAAVGLRA